MAFFPNAHRQVFVVENPSAFAVTGKTDELAPGYFGFFDPRTWLAIETLGATVAEHSSVIFAMGNRHTKDKIGTHGGYKESIKSKPIDPRYVHRFYKVAGRSAANQQVVLGYKEMEPTSSPKFKKGQEYLLRVDVKGSPALRTLGRNLYRTFDAGTGCVDDCVDPCEPGADIDPVVIFLQWAEQIKADPIFSSFIAPVVHKQIAGTMTIVEKADYVEELDPAIIATIQATLTLDVAYIDTVFGTCSFDTQDHFEMEPLQIYTSLVDETGNPCKTAKLFSYNGQESHPADGLGHQIIRDMILFNRYRQEPFQKDPRRREIEESAAISFDYIEADQPYDTYYLLYSVPRTANPSSMHDADQYLLQVSMLKREGTLSAFEGWMSAYLASANNPVKLERFS